MNNTLTYYETNAIELCSRYEAARLDYLYSCFSGHFARASCLLEIGCGSGRDAAHLISRNYNIFAIDGSENMLRQALQAHPELKGKVCVIRLPAVLPFKDEAFDGFYSIACLMHFKTAQISEIVSEAFRVVKPGGSGLVSVPVRRSDIDNRGIDDKGRAFYLLETAQWLDLFNKCGFSAQAGEEQPDGANREGISWINYFLNKNNLKPCATTN